MQVTSYQRQIKHPRRGPVAGGLLLWFASIAGGFGGGVRRKMRAEPWAPRIAAQGYSASFALRVGLCEQVTNKSLSSNISISCGDQPGAGRQGPLEICRHGSRGHESGFRIDYGAFPQWQPFPGAGFARADVELDSVVARSSTGFHGSDVARSRTMSTLMI